MFSNQRDSPEVLFIVFQRYSFFQFYLRPVYIRETKFLHPGPTDCWRYTERAFKERCNCPITLPTTLQRPLSWRSSTGPILANKSGKIGCGRTLSPGVKASANSASWHYWHKGLNSSRQCRSTVVTVAYRPFIAAVTAGRKVGKKTEHTVDRIACWSIITRPQIIGDNRLCWKGPPTSATESRKWYLLGLSNRMRSHKPRSRVFVFLAVKKNLAEWLKPDDNGKNGSDWCLLLITNATAAAAADYRNDHDEDGVSWWQCKRSTKSLRGSAAAEGPRDALHHVQRVVNKDAPSDRLATVELRRQCLRRSTVRAVTRKRTPSQSYNFRTTFQRELLVFLQICEFPREVSAGSAKSSLSVKNQSVYSSVSITMRTCDGWTYGRTPGIYRASIASR